MTDFIKLISDTSKDIIYQLINEEMEIEKRETTKELELQEAISVVSSFMSKKNSFQIIISFSDELVKKISSASLGGLPIVTIDSESKYIVMEISKLIISNSVIFLDEYDECCLLSNPIIIDGDNITYSTDGVVKYIDFNLMNEKLTIAIFQQEKIDYTCNMKMIEKNIYS